MELCCQKCGAALVEFGSLVENGDCVHISYRCANWHGTEIQVLPEAVSQWPFQDVYDEIALVARDLGWVFRDVSNLLYRITATTRDDILAEIEKPKSRIGVLYRADPLVADLLDLAMLGDASADLSTMPYSAYLKTDHWKEQREAAKERANHRCQICNSDGALEVHHRTYERRGVEEPGDLIALCRGCHATFHKPVSGRATRMPGGA